jgi:hypothetical protein
MPPVGFEPTISADERQQTYALDRAATGTGNTTAYGGKFIYGNNAFKTVVANTMATLLVFPFLPNQQHNVSFQKTH